MTPIDRVQQHIASGKRLIVASRRIQVGDVLDRFCWVSGWVDQPVRVIAQVSFEVFVANAPVGALGWESGPGDYRFYELASD